MFFIQYWNTNGWSYVHGTLKRNTVLLKTTYKVHSLYESISINITRRQEVIDKKNEVIEFLMIWYDYVVEN